MSIFVERTQIWISTNTEQKLNERGIFGVAEAPLAMVSRNRRICFSQVKWDNLALIALGSGHAALGKKLVVFLLSHRRELAAHPMA